MLLTYYGTGAGAGVPEIFCSCRVCEYARRHGGRDIRTRSQATVDHLMIDFPVDTFAHCVYYGLDMRACRDVLITHTHHDHYCPGDLVSRYEDEASWRFYLPEPAALRERERLAQTAARPNLAPYRRWPEIISAAAFEPLQIGTATVTPLPSNHAPSIGSVLYLIENGGKRLLWIHDSGRLLPETIDYLRSKKPALDAVSLDGTLKTGCLLSAAHMDMPACRDTVNLLRDIGCVSDSTRLILSHVGHLHEKTHEELAEEARGYGFTLAYDTMRIEI